MAKILIIGDLHFKSSNLVEGNELVLKILQKRAEIEDLDAIVFLGDLLDNHATVHSQSLNLVNKLLLGLKSDTVFVLVGNHDYINNSQFMTTQHPFNSFKQWNKKHLHIVDKAVEWKCGDEKFLFIPYVPTGRFNEAIKNHTEDVLCIFAHQEFKGSVFDNVGDEWNGSLPVISGHIHEKRTFPNNIFYPGSPVQHSFAETPNKTICVLDTKSGTNFTYHMLDMLQKHTIEHDLADIDNLVLPLNATVRLRLKCTASSWTVFKKSKKYRELIDAKVKIQPLAIDDDVQIKRMASKRTTYIEALTTYAEKSGGFIQEAFQEVMKGIVYAN